jgi:hypothetical protein
MNNRKGQAAMEFEISGLETSNVIYFSDDGINFSWKNSVVLYPHKKNYLCAPPNNFFLFETDLMEGKEPVGDGEITAEDSDWHEKVNIDSRVFYVPSPLMYRRVVDYLKRTGKRDQ